MTAKDTAVTTHRQIFRVLKSIDKTIVRPGKVLTGSQKSFIQEIAEISQDQDLIQEAESAICIDDFDADLLDEWKDAIATWEVWKTSQITAKQERFLIDLYERENRDADVARIKKLTKVEASQEIDQILNGGVE